MALISDDFHTLGNHSQLKDYIKPVFLQAWTVPGT